MHATLCDQGVSYFHGVIIVNLDGLKIDEAFTSMHNTTICGLHIAKLASLYERRRCLSVAHCLQRFGSGTDTMPAGALL